MYLFNSTVLVEPTNICNLKCVMCEARCTVEAGMNKAEYLMPDDFDLILSKLEKYISNVVFQGDCEPTLNPYLPELVKVASKYTKQIAIVTNGTMLKPELTDNLIKSGVNWFALSIDDYRKNIYNGIRKYSDYDKVMNNLKYLIKYRNEKMRSLYIVTHKIVFPDNTKEDLIGYINYFYKKMGVNKVTFAPLVSEGNIKEKNWLIERNHLENELIARDIQINLKDFANYPYMVNHKYCGTNLFFISHEGNFAPCGLHTRDHKIFGNLIEENLDDIIKRRDFIEYHEYWSNRKFDQDAPKICENCYLLRSPYFRYCLDDGYEVTETIYEKNNGQLEKVM